MAKRIGVVALALGLLISASCWYVLSFAPIAQAVGVHIDGLSNDALKKVRVVLIGPNQDQAYNVRAVDGAAGYWRFDDPVWIGAAFIQMPKTEFAHLESVEIGIGMDEPVRFTRSEIQQSWSVEDAAAWLPPDKRALGDVVLWLPDRFARHSSLGLVAAKLAIKTPRGTVTNVPWNWPGDASFVRAVLQYALVPGVLLAFIFVRRLRHIYQETDGPPHGVKEKWYDILGPLFLIAMLTVLEWRDPYYFTQDDNLVESLPMILVGCRGIWHGEFPDYNPYVYLGSPLASLGMYGLTYPPLVLSYAFARHVLADEFATIDVFVIVHLLAGFFVIRLLGRKHGMGSLTANLTALSCVLSGPALVMGRCWFNFTPVFVWLPVLLISVVHLRNGPVSWKWTLGTGLAAGLSFHVGFSQAALYVNGFFCLAVLYLVVVRAIPWRRAVMVVPALLIGAGVALPLVYQQLIFTRDLIRHDASETGVATGLPAMLLPHPLVEATLPVPLGSEFLERQGEFYFFGGVLALVFLFEIAGCFCANPFSIRWHNHVWMVLALFALWLALGRAGGLWLAVKELPIIGTINRHPLRLMPFVVMFVSLSGGAALERMLQSWPRKLSHGLAIMALLLLTLHVAMCRVAFYTYRFEPYPELPEPMVRLFGEHAPARVCSWANQRSTAADFARFLPQDLPAVYGLCTADGYCPLLGGKTQTLAMIGKLHDQPLAAMTAYGIRWHLTYAGSRPTPHTPVASASWALEAVNKAAQFPAAVSPEKFQHAGTADGILTTELPDASPLAFAADEPQRGLKLTMGAGGVDVNVSGFDRGRRVVVNFLYYPHIQAYVDGVATACAPDSWQRIQVQVPARKSTLAIRYEPPWAMGVWLGLAAGAAGVIAGWLCLRRIV